MSLPYAIERVFSKVRGNVEYFLKWYLILFALAERKKNEIPLDRSSALPRQSIYTARQVWYHTVPGHTMVLHV